MESSQTNYNETSNSLNISNGLVSKNITSNDLSSSQNPMINSNTSRTVIPNQQKSVKPKKEEPGLFGRFANYLKSFWEIEEEEYIDAHGFVSKRPKTKIPLRNKKDKDNNKVQAEGANSLNYATQHSAFGRIFL